MTIGLEIYVLQVESLLIGGTCALCSQKATEGALWVRQPALRGIAGPLLAGSQAALCGIVSLDRHQISTLCLHQEHKTMIITYNKNDNDDGARGCRDDGDDGARGCRDDGDDGDDGDDEDVEHTEHDDKTMLNHHSKMRSRGGMRMRMMLNLYQMQRSVKLSFLYFSLLIASHRMDKWTVTHKHQCTKSKPRYRCRFPLQGKEPSPFPWSTRTSCKLASSIPAQLGLCLPTVDRSEAGNCKLAAVTSSLAPNASSCKLQTGISTHYKAKDMIHYYAMWCWHVQGLWEWGIVGLDLSEKWHFLEDIHYDIYIYCMV